ncbi:membrane protein RL13 [Human betaherpesvirus 5]|nr:membrane protein RL13 [Human betaherpesvirus 5]
MDWRVTVTWTILISTLSESCKPTCPCQCLCNDTTTNYSINTTSTTVINNISTPESSDTTTRTDCSATTAQTTTVSTEPSVTTTRISTLSTKIETTTCMNTTTNVTCDGLNYTVHKTCGRSYEVINVTGHVGSNVTLKKCNHTIWHNVDWIKYEESYSSYKMCELGNYHQTTPRSNICFECNDTSLTIYNLTAENAGKYTRRDRYNGYEENYYVTVLYEGSTSSTPGTCPVKYRVKSSESTNTEGTVGSNLIETIRNTNIPLGIHAVWAGIVVSVALIALYMGSRRIPRKPRYTRLPKHDPDEFWTKT